MDTSLINAYILRKAVLNNERLPLFEFKLAVSTALMHAENFSEPLSRAAAVLREVIPRAANGDPIAGPSPVDAVRLDGMNHWPEQVAKVGRRCRVSGCSLRSTFWCTKCCVYLCIKGGKLCFVEYHTQ